MTPRVLSSGQGYLIGKNVLGYLFWLLAQTSFTHGLYFIKLTASSEQIGQYCFFNPYILSE